MGIEGLAWESAVSHFPVVFCNQYITRSLCCHVFSRLLLWEQRIVLEKSEDKFVLCELG